MKRQTMTQEEMDAIKVQARARMKAGTHRDVVAAKERSESSATPPVPPTPPTPPAPADQSGQTPERKKTAISGVKAGPKLPSFKPGTAQGLAKTMRLTREPREPEAQEAAS